MKQRAERITDNAVKALLQALQRQLEDTSTVLDEFEATHNDLECDRSKQYTALVAGHFALKAAIDKINDQLNKSETMDSQFKSQEKLAEAYNFAKKDSNLLSPPDTPNACYPKEQLLRELFALSERLTCATCILGEIQSRLLRLQSQYIQILRQDETRTPSHQTQEDSFPKSYEDPRHDLQVPAGTMVLTGADEL